MPLFARKFLVDAIESAAGAVLFLSVAGDADAVAHAAGAAVFAAVVSAARRAYPGFRAYLREVFHADPDAA